MLLEYLYAVLKYLLSHKIFCFQHFVGSCILKNFSFLNISKTILFDSVVFLTFQRLRQFRAKLQLKVIQFQILNDGFMLKNLLLFFPEFRANFALNLNQFRAQEKPDSITLKNCLLNLITEMFQELARFFCLTFFRVNIYQTNNNSVYIKQYMYLFTCNLYFF